MAVFETWLNQDLQKPLKPQVLDGSLFTQDNAGNLVGVVLFNNGEPEEISGTVGGMILRADGATVAVVDGNSNGNKGWIVLPQSAYAVPGQIVIVIKVTNGSTVTTIGAATVGVQKSSTDTIVDPGTIISGIDTLIATIDAAIDSIPADWSSLLTSIAPVFSTNTAYNIGDYVWHTTGADAPAKLYKFTSAHAVGAWDATQATAAVLSTDIKNLQHIYTPVSGKPTSNLMPAFGGTVTLSQVAQDINGQMTVTDRTLTIPNSTATQSAAGLMSANDKTKLNNMTPLYYGECTTAAATQEKTVTISGITALTNGLTIFVRFVNPQTYNGIPLLNVNNLGALYIYRSGGIPAGASEWQAETVLALTKYEDVWFIVDGDRATTGRYGKTILNSNTTSNSASSAVNSAGLREFIENVISNAPIYSDSSAYAEGDYVRKDNKIYRCTDAKAAGAAWSDMDWVGMPQIYDVIDSLYTRKIQYSGTCSTEAATQTKVATGIGANYRDIDGLYFKDGVVVYVKFDYAQGYNGTPMLSVNGTVGNIYYNDVQPAGLNAWNGGQTLAFRLKRTTGIMRWYIVGTTYDPATTSVNGLMSYSDKKKLDELEVGGRNLLLNSTKPDVYSDDLTLAVTRNVAVPEWGATDATRITGSGGAYNYVCYVGGKAENIAYGKYIGESGKNYTISIYIKNNHSTNKCGVRINLPYDPGYTMIDPGAAMKVEQTATGNGNVRLAIFFSTKNVGEAFDFTIWHPMIETGTMPTDWTPAPEDYYAAIAATQEPDMVAFLNICNTSLFNTSAQVDGELSRVGKVVTLTFNAEVNSALTEYVPYEIATLPSGYIPDTDFYFAIKDDYNSFPANWGEVRVSSGSNGKVYIRVGQHNIPANSHISGSATWILA